MQVHKPFHLYNASAGSGKTFSLVVSFLGHILTQPKLDYFKHIVAVTFTNKAANEMKTRLIDALIELSSEDYKNHPMMADLVKKTLKTEEEINLLAYQRIRYILHNYSLLSFYTLDKFNVRLTKNFTKELNLSYGFNLEIDRTKYYEEAYDLLIDSITEKNPNSKSIIDYFVNAFENENSIYTLVKDTKETLEKFEDEDSYKYILPQKDLSLADYNKVKQKVWKEIKEAEKQVKNLAQNALNIMSKSGVELTDFSGGMRSGLGVLFLKITQDTVKNENHFTKIEKFDSDSFTSKKTEDKEPIIQSIIGELKSIYTKIVLHYQKYILAKSMQKELLSFQVHNQISKHIDDLKEEKDLVFVSDINKIISEHLQVQPSAFIYEKLGTRYFHYYFDEFQDTSQLQWDNFSPLKEEIVSQENRSLSIIGDPKQSIYRFRGGNPEIMLDIIKDAKKNPDFYKSIPLQTNYRSQKNIVDFNNKFYKYISNQIENDLYKELFGEIGQQNSLDKNNKGLVHFSVLNNENFVEEELYTIYQRLLECKKQGFSYSDIAILTKNNKQIRLISEFLLQQEESIESSTEFSSLLSENHAVMTLIAAMRWIEKPDDDTYFHDFMYHFCHSSSLVSRSFEEEIIEYFIPQKIKYSLFKERYKIDLRASFDNSLGLYNLIEIWIRELQFSDENQPYLIHFLDCIIDQESQSGISIHHFLEFWDEKSDSLNTLTPENENAVQILTVHKSKGLEFKVVILPNIKQKGKKQIWIPVQEEYEEITYCKTSTKAAKIIQSLNSNIAETVKTSDFEEQIDEICNYYVATTRAEEQLYIIQNYNNLNYFSEFLIDQNLLAAPNSKNTKTFENTAFLFFENSDPKALISALKKEIKFKSIPLQYNSFRWNDRLKIASEIHQQFTSNAIEKGNTLHALLSYIETENDIEKVIQKAINTQLIAEIEAVEIQSQLEEIVLKSEISDYFSDKYKIYNEKEIRYNNKYIRPDRILQKDQKYTLIDYKTGNKESKHQKQMEMYKNALQHLGLSVEKSLLVYIGDTIECIEI